MTPRPLPAPLESRDCSSSVECTFEKGEFHPSTIYSIFMVHIVLLMSRTLDNGGEIYSEGAFISLCLYRVSEGKVFFFNLDLRERNIQVRLYLKVVVKS